MNRASCYGVKTLPTIQADKLTKIASSIVEATGTPSDEARIVAEHLVRSNLSGHDSHGIIRLPYYLKVIKEGLIKPGAKMKIVKETVSIALVDGNWNWGQVTGKQAMEVAIEKAKATGIGMVALYNVFHTGRVGEYPEIALEHDMVGIAFGGGSKTPQVVHPLGLTRVVGTNPISITIPASEERPFLLDMATSVVAGGKLSWYLSAGKDVPDGWILDSEGRPTTNPADFRPPLKEFAHDIAQGKPTKRGSLLPFGDYKGFGLSMFIELLGGFLAESGQGVRGGFIFIAIDISQFRPVEEFKKSVGSFIRKVKNSEKRPGVTEILVAGDPEFNTRAERLQTGIYIEDGTWNDVQEAAKELRVDLESILKE